MEQYYFTDDAHILDGVDVHDRHDYENGYDDAQNGLTDDYEDPY